MLKEGVALLGVGAAATGGFLAYNGVSNSKTKTYSIKDLLATKNPKKRLIAKSTDGSSPEWKAVWKLYATEYKNNNHNLFSLASINSEKTIDDNQPAPSEFMSKCESLVMEHVVNEKDDKYQGVLKYCTRDALIKDLILESGRVVLQESDDWGDSWKSYRAANTDKEDQQDTWKLKDWNTKKSNDSTISDDLKKKCKEKLEAKVGDQVDGDYSNIVKWCSK
ncbi:hypothetical protein HF1_02590 [Mycoplasma haemofelis str. Langford 1]|uniref:Uncharacterized protein n=1 Tax=Mycoplasma haemofelis (strain Langford 1) TaxID=941640 RepID=E8ZKV1_MYCHL|nr:hypothetical protein [Mycoplasma haemofelis]CBY92267.1 hypothetical protein HF1_02590 [Mycoplasma haemofelis str. Langford 1]